MAAIVAVVTGGVARSKNVGWTHGERAERKPITGVWGRAPSGVQEQRPWSGGQSINLMNDLWQKWGGHVYHSPPRGDAGPWL